MAAARTPTPTQHAVLALLHAFGLLTTQQVYEYLETLTTKRAVEQLLVRLQSYGWIVAAPLDPTRPGRSPYYWTLTPPGAALLGVAPPPRSGRITVQRLLQVRPTLSPKRMAILRLLAEWRQLTTSQIGQELHPERPRSYTKRALGDLRRTGFIQGRSCDPHRGSTSEYYWFLRAPGAYALAVPYDTHFRRHPSHDTLAFRGLQLDLMRQAYAAGWAVIPAARYSRAHPRPATTPQTQHLIAVVLAHECRALAAALAQGTPPQLLEHRQALLRIGSTGAIVPPAVNDYVVYRPAAPDEAVVLIPHPPYAGPSFWTHKTRGQQHLGEPVGHRDSRLDRYRRLARILPVLAVFPTREVAAQYIPILTAAGFDWVLAVDVGARLSQLGAQWAE
jgi:hypothetical protein